MPEISPAYSPEHHNVVQVSAARLLLRACGIAFFSIASLAAAFFAFIALPQVQDLLFDARPSLPQEILYWTGFYLIGIFIWALPLVYTARLLMLQNFDVIGVNSEGRFRFYVFRFPTLLAVFAFLAVLFGVLVASSNLPAPSPADGGNPAEMPLRAYVERHLITLFIATAIVLVLVIVRNFFIVGYDRFMESFEKRYPERFKRILIQVEKLSRNHKRNLEDMDLHLTALKPDFLSDESWIMAQRVKVFMWRYLLRVGIFVLVLIGLHYLSYSEKLQNLLSLPAFTPSSELENIIRIVSDTFWMKRAMFLFFVFGAWLPFATFLAMLSNRWQFPVITTLFLVAIGLTVVISDGHDARVLTLTNEQQAKLHPVGFVEAINNWKISSGWIAKGCDQPLLADITDCPRPIIVAGEGGGSRAAFLIASVLGNLEDDSLKQVRETPGARPFHQQLFAISSVSGSSVGAAFYISALKTQSSVEINQLKTAIYKQRLWFLNVAKAGTGQEKFLGSHVTYKDALQAALSNDFLSPVVVGYFARDLLMFSRLPYVMDRAGVLETSWEQAFNNVYGTTPQTSPLSAPLLTFGPTQDDWTPLLFLNSTSIETGRRIIFTPVKMTELVKNAPLVIDAYDGDEILCSEKDVAALRTLDKIARILPYRLSPVSNAKCDDAQKPVSIGIRLSTAAGMSSRSPFVSPHANLRDRSGQIADSAVDGGYFDNSGSVTAFEIATALKAVDGRLQPYIIQVSSEPDWFKETKSCGETDDDFDGRPDIPDEADFKPFGTLGNVLTINATRVARGFETIMQLPGQVGRLNGIANSSSRIYICPQRKENFFSNKFAEWFAPNDAARLRMTTRSMQRKAVDQSQLGWKSVSLSWWLSPPLQAYLDAQVFSRHNLPTRTCVLSLLRDRKFDERTDFSRQCGK